MIELETEKYSILIEPVKKVNINILFARSVIEKKVSGKIFVDNSFDPTTFYIIHPYGMTLLFGNSNNEEFNKQFADYALNKDNLRNSSEWMQVFPETWDRKLEELLGDRLIKSGNKLGNENRGIVELYTRINFKFNIDKYLSFKQRYIKEEHDIVRTNDTIFKKMKGSVVPSNFWDNAEDFHKYGVGFSLFHKGKLATTAYSAFIFDNKLELGMETIPEFRGRGFAKYACSALIDYCIENNYEPIWACMYENIPSYQLAQKLGFEPSISLTYYRLND
jgi:hypothetical protein